MTKKVYLVDTSYGQTIRCYDEKNHYEQCCYEIGNENIVRISLATIADISWTIAMGGRVPIEAQKMYDER